MEILLAQILGPFLFVLGLSVALYADQWVKVFKEFQKNHFLLLSTSIVSLLFGLVFVRMYNVWEMQPYVLVTLIGWAMVLKPVIYFLAPEKVLKKMYKLATKNLLIFGGLIDTAIGAALIYLGYFI